MFLLQLMNTGKAKNLFSSELQIVGTIQEIPYEWLTWWPKQQLTCHSETKQKTAAF